jgi:TatD DNase family protein
LIPFVNIHTHQIHDGANNINITDWFTSTTDKRKQLLHFSSGIHPWFIDEINFENQFEEVKKQANNLGCKAIGECGLDKLKGPELQFQISIFERQIALAIQIEKPVIVHCVKAYDVLMAIIKKYKSKTVFIIHGFNQNEQLAKQLLKTGVYLSFGSALLNDKSDRLREIFAQTNNEQLFIENDDSMVSIEQIYKVAASIKKCELNVMKEIIFANYKKVFKHE